MWWILFDMLEALVADYKNEYQCHLDSYTMTVNYMYCVPSRRLCSDGAVAFIDTIIIITNWWTCLHHEL